MSETDLGFINWLCERIRSLSFSVVAYNKDLKADTITDILEKCCDNLEDIAYVID